MPDDPIRQVGLIDQHAAQGNIARHGGIGPVAGLQGDRKGALVPGELAPLHILGGIEETQPEQELAK